MKIIVFTQDNCGWCVRLHPHIQKLSDDFMVDLEFVDITGKWELAEEYSFRTTPTVALLNEGVILRKFSIEPVGGIAGLISKVKDFIK